MGKAIDVAERLQNDKGVPYGVLREYAILVSARLSDIRILIEKHSNAAMAVDGPCADEFDLLDEARDRDSPEELLMHVQERCSLLLGELTAYAEENESLVHRTRRWKAAAKVWRDRERIDALPPGYTKRQREQPPHYESQWPQVRPSKEVTDD